MTPHELVEAFKIEEGSYDSWTFADFSEKYPDNLEILASGLMWDQRRWTTSFLDVYSLNGDVFGISYEQGSTEYQEDDYEFYIVPVKTIETWGIA